MIACVLALMLSPARAQRIEAVLILYDDDEHTFKHVCTALEGLGISPPNAMLITSDVHSVGVGLVLKGPKRDLEQGLKMLLGASLNASIVQVAEVDREVKEAERMLAVSKLLGAKNNRTLFKQCNLWALAGA